MKEVYKGCLYITYISVKYNYNFILVDSLIKKIYPILELVKEIYNKISNRLYL